MATTRRTGSAKKGTTRSSAKKLEVSQVEEQVAVEQPESKPQSPDIAAIVAAEVQGALAPVLEGFQTAVSTIGEQNKQIESLKAQLQEVSAAKAASPQPVVPQPSLVGGSLVPFPVGGVAVHAPEASPVDMPELDPNGADILVYYEPNSADAKGRRTKAPVMVSTVTPKPNLPGQFHTETVGFIVGPQRKSQADMIKVYASATTSPAIRQMLEDDVIGIWGTTIELSEMSRLEAKKTVRETRDKGLLEYWERTSFDSLTPTLQEALKNRMDELASGEGADLSPFRVKQRGVA